MDLRLATQANTHTTTRDPYKSHRTGSVDVMVHFVTVVAEVDPFKSPPASSSTAEDIQLRPGSTKVPRHLLPNNRNHSNITRRESDQMFAADAHTFSSCCSAPVQIHKRKNVFGKKKKFSCSASDRLHPKTSCWQEFAEGVGEESMQQLEKCVCENYNYLLHVAGILSEITELHGECRTVFTRQTEKDSRLRLKNAFAAARQSNTPLTPSNIPRIAQPTVKQGRDGRPAKGPASRQPAGQVSRGKRGAVNAVPNTMILRVFR